MKTFKKIFSCALVVISFILIFTSWTMLTPQAKDKAVDYYNTYFTPEDEAANFSRVIREVRSFDPEEVLDEKTAETSTGQFLTALYQDGSEFKALAAAVQDGGLDVTQTALAARSVKNIFGYMHDQKEAFGITDEVGYLRGTGALSVYNVVVIVLFILTILIAVATFIVRFFDRFRQYRKYDLAFFVAQLLLFIMTLIFVGSMNSLAGGFPALGISLWGIIAVILSCPSLLLDQIPFEKAQPYAGPGTVVNETAYAVSGTVTKTMGKISSKVDETAQSVRLVRELKANEEQLKSRYTDLGKRYYEAFAENPPEDMKDVFQEIRDQQARMVQLEKDIDTMNNVVACTGCGAKWSVGTKFCANCGTKLPTIESFEDDREEIDNEMKMKKEKKAGKSFCKYCGAKVEDDDEFCPGCGRSI